MPSFSRIMPAPDYFELRHAVSRKQPKQPTDELPVGLQAGARSFRTIVCEH
jgi:hypothetical protein